MLEHATTGDGILTGLHLMSRMASSGQSLAQLASVMTRLPQVLIISLMLIRAGRQLIQLSAAVMKLKPSSGIPAGFCCDLLAQSRWCASWWRPRAMRWPTAWRISVIGEDLTRPSERER